MTKMASCRRIGLYHPDGVVRWRQLTMGALKKEQKAVSICM